MKKPRYTLLVALLLSLSISASIIPSRTATGNSSPAVMVNHRSAQGEDNGRIRGRVTDMRGGPLKGIYVEAYTDADGAGIWSPWAGARTDSTGAYSIESLEPATYRIAFQDFYERFTTEYYQNAATMETATDIVVAENTVEHIDAQLAGPTGRIQGVVRDESNALLEQADIEVIQDRDHNGSWEGVGAAETEADGTYAVAGLPDGAYRVRFFDRVDQYRYCPFLRYAVQYYPNVETLAAATDVLVQSGNTVTNINARLAAAGEIRGRVTDLNNHPITWHWVFASSSRENAQCFASLTGSDGAYAIGVADGVYRVFFSTRAGYSPYVSHTAEYYDNAASFEAATDIAVVNRSIVTDINAQLAPAGTIRGVVTNLNGGRLSQIQVTAYQQVAGQWQPFTTTTTDAGGAYALPGVGGETYSGVIYRVGFVDLRTPPQYHSKVYLDAGYPEMGQDIFVMTHEEVLGKNISLAPLDSINLAPFALDDQMILFQTGTTNLWPSVASVLTNDREAEAEPISAVLVDSPSAGVLTLHSDGTFTYTPNTSPWESDTFTYRAHDQTLDSNLATVTIVPGVGRLFLPFIAR